MKLAFYVSRWAILGQESPKLALTPEADMTIDGQRRFRVDLDGMDEAIRVNNPAYLLNRLDFSALEEGSVRDYTRPGAPCVPTRIRVSNLIARIEYLEYRPDDGPGKGWSARVPNVAEADTPLVHRLLRQIDQHGTPAEIIRGLLEERGQQVLDAEYMAGEPEGARQVIWQRATRHWWVGVEAEASAEALQSLVDEEAEIDCSDTNFGFLEQQIEAIREGRLRWIARMVVDVRYCPNGVAASTRDHQGRPLDYETRKSESVDHVTWLPGEVLPRLVVREAFRQCASGRHFKAIGPSPALPRDHASLPLRHEEDERIAGIAVPFQGGMGKPPSPPKEEPAATKREPKRSQARVINLPKRAA